MSVSSLGYIGLSNGGTKVDYVSIHIIKNKRTVTVKIQIRDKLLWLYSGHFYRANL